MFVDFYAALVYFSLSSAECRGTYQIGNNNIIGAGFKLVNQEVGDNTIYYGENSIRPLSEANNIEKKSYHKMYLDFLTS